jgi:hypothetical protein
LQASDGAWHDAGAVVGDGESIVNEVVELWNELRALEYSRCAKSDSGWAVHDVRAGMRLRVSSLMIFFASGFVEGYGCSWHDVWSVYVGLVYAVASVKFFELIYGHCRLCRPQLNRTYTDITWLRWRCMGSTPRTLRRHREILYRGLVWSIWKYMRDMTRKQMGACARNPMI